MKLSKNLQATYCQIQKLASKVPPTVLTTNYNLGILSCMNIVH